jgi:hypothetical protein
MALATSRRGPSASFRISSLPISFWKLTFDCRFILNSACNRDRGPVSVVGTGLHAQF